MIKLIFIISIFIFQPLYAESIRDFENQSDRKLDQEYKCDEWEGSIKLNIGLHKIKGNTFILFHNGVNGYFVHSASRVYKKKQNDILVTSYVFSWPSNHGLAGAILTKNFLIKGDTHLYVKYLKNYGSTNWVQEHAGLFTDFSEDFDQRLIDYNERALKVIFKELDFGEPFKPSDIYAIDIKKLTGGHFFLCK